MNEYRWLKLFCPSNALAGMALFDAHEYAEHLEHTWRNRNDALLSNRWRIPLFAAGRDRPSRHHTCKLESATLARLPIFLSVQFDARNGKGIPPTRKRSSGRVSNSLQKRERVKQTSCKYNKHHAMQQQIMKRSVQSAGDNWPTKTNKHTRK